MSVTKLFRTSSFPHKLAKNAKSNDGFSSARLMPLGENTAARCCGLAPSDVTKVSTCARVTSPKAAPANRMSSPAVVTPARSSLRRPHGESVAPSVAKNDLEVPPAGAWKKSGSTGRARQSRPDPSSLSPVEAPRPRAPARQRRRPRAAERPSAEAAGGADAAPLVQRQPATEAGGKLDVRQIDEPEATMLHSMVNRFLPPVKWETPLQYSHAGCV